MRAYVFVFLGEFGYELLNWQGVIRKFAKKKDSGTQIICCSRKGLENFYESADIYIDISKVELFSLSVANGYRGVSPELNDHRLKAGGLSGLKSTPAPERRDSG